MADLSGWSESDFLEYDIPVFSLLQGFTLTLCTSWICMIWVEQQHLS